MQHFHTILLGILALPTSLATAWSSSSSPRQERFHRVMTAATTQVHHVVPLQSTTTSSARKSRTMTKLMALSGGDRVEKSKNDDENNALSKSAFNLSVAAVLASSFLNLLGFTMAGPITPALGQHFGLQVGASFGSLTSAYPLGMLLGLFLWPPLSDKIGRKPVMALSLLGSGLGLAAQAYVIFSRKSLGLFLATRVLTGSFSGASAVAKAYLADKALSDNNKLTKFLAWRDAASTMAFIVGPLFGGLIYDMRRRLILSSDTQTNIAEALIDKTSSSSLSFVIGMSAVASLIASFLITLFVKENRSGTTTTKQRSKLFKEKKEEMDYIACPLGAEMWAGVASVCVVSFLFNVGDSTFHAFFSALMRDRLALGTRAIGMAYTVFASVSFTVSATLASGSIRVLGPVATCAAGLSATALGLGLLSFDSTMKLLALGAAALYYSGVPLYAPTIPTMLLRCVAPNRRGAVMGLDGAINTVARVISPLLMGELYRRYGAAMAFRTAAIASGAAAATALVRRYMVIRYNEKELGITKRNV